ncbi:hypothetical protein [Ancylobacter polymorphus]|uniref:Uncharacterized protein n=1 Tax=Ancylobacter polymorphus TaxID=223390 RepID=A0ABU0B6C5_9HYPH|nr:hypothetical protein [Ancylobacter polymorphus]MDQ0301368.1 hypothetical protein [Ancylobacter polymorphus]
MAIDYEALFGAAEYDPCSALQAMRPAYMRMVAGAAVEKVSFRDRETWFNRTDIKEFGRLIERLESECMAKQGRGPRRFAIQAGSRPCPPGYDPFKV